MDVNQIAAARLPERSFSERGAGASQKSAPSSEEPESTPAPEVSGPPQAEAAVEKPAPPPKREVSSAVQEMVEEINQKLQHKTQISLHFSRHEDSGEMIIQIIDKQTREVIRQIPPEGIVDLSRRLDEMKGLILNAKG